MTGGLSHATFNRSGLVRILSETIPDAIDPKYDLGERLGQWLDFADALALYSALNSGGGATSVAGANANPAVRPLHDQLARVRRNLSDSILNDGVFSAETARIRFPTPLPQATAESAADFTPYHRYYLAHQRDMSAAIGALRANARKALADHSPPLRQLAEVDASFEKILAARERTLLGTIPMLLAKRFAQRYQEHRDSLSEAAADDPALWTQPGRWLEAFCRDAQAVLLSELELRLKPVAGLIAALGAPGESTETSKQ
ncbi:DUF3348 domain-containing protein [Dechloromonas sp. XY25]|uniref:DUF3348 domain-containing protein n=1 Tax=Dechloromonas hankyongensis TaxID=2908002 RepID=A0ABS9K235_9RHOO|nr:DUF3348 domain-containing protein [Dechloromonas hankyongensis]MCG2577246.1 DUF3348 domain-containing protein [Dechloromonas hankyongensis]